MTLDLLSDITPANIVLVFAALIATRILMLAVESIAGGLFERLEFLVKFEILLARLEGGGQIRTNLGVVSLCYLGLLGVVQLGGSGSMAGELVHPMYVVGLVSSGLLVMAWAAWRLEIPISSPKELLAGDGNP